MMSQETMPSSSNNEWLQYYQQPTLNHDNHHHQAHAVVGTNTLSKAIRRRSRASKKTPTTLLNANANNFRALVQKFTGCPRNSVSLANQKGPVNWNFGLKNATPMVETFHNHYDYRRESQVEVPPQNEQQESYFEGNNFHDILGQHNQRTYSSSPNATMTSDVFSHDPIAMNASGAVEISTGYVMDQNLSFNEFAHSEFIFE